MVDQQPLTRVEFYRVGGGGLIDACRAASVPRTGEFICIEGKTWKVVRVTWALDTDPPWGKDLRANVEMEDPNDR